MGLSNVCWNHRAVLVDAHGLKGRKSCFNHQPKIYKPENSLTCVCVSFPFEPSCKSPPDLHQSKSSRWEPHPIQEPGFTAVQAITSLLLWSIIHKSKREWEKRKKMWNQGKTWEEDTRRRGAQKKKTRWLRGENRGNKDGETKAGAVSGREIGGAAAATAPCSVFCHSSKNSSSNHSRTKKKKTHSTVCAAAESEMEDSRNRSGHNG